MTASSPRPLILFAHGAGVPSTSPWMVGWAARLAAFGDVVTFDYPYMKEGRRRPDRQTVLLQAHRAEYERATRGHAGPVVLAGKSMGSRMSCLLAADVAAAAVICFGFPLRSPGGAVRRSTLHSVRVPVLLVQGTRDRLCPLDLLEETRQGMSAPSTLHVVESGDHSLQATKTWLKGQGIDQASVDDAIQRAVGAFLAGLDLI